MPFQEPVNSARMVSVTSREESGRTSRSAWKLRMRSSRAASGEAARHANRKAATMQAARPAVRAIGVARAMGSGSGRRSRSAETDLRNFAFGGRADLEKFARLESAHAGDEIGGKLRDARI